MLSKPNKPKIQDSITCNKCGQPSGFTNHDIAEIKGNQTLKCQKCGHVCIKVLTSKISAELHEKSSNIKITDYKETIIENKIKFEEQAKAEELIERETELEKYLKMTNWADVEKENKSEKEEEDIGKEGC
jgi:uncharacterized Zn finger protein